MIDNKLKRILAVSAAVTALALGGAAIAGAASGGDDEGRDDDAAEQVSGAGAERARKAALAKVGGGQVTSVERADDGDTGYEVEIDRPDGVSVEVNVDEGFAVRSVEEDD